MMSLHGRERVTSSAAHATIAPMLTLNVSGERARALYARTCEALRMTQQQFGDLVGVSRRTIIRWGPHPGLTAPQWAELARAVHPLDRELAAEIAKGLEQTLVSLGLEAPPRPASPAPTPRDLADSVVCAAAEAAGTTPQVMRPALFAAFTRACAVGLSAEQTRDALGPEPPPRSRK